MMRGLTFLFVQVALLRGVLGAVVLPLAGTLLGVGVLVFVVVEHFVEDVFVVYNIYDFSI